MKTNEQGFSEFLKHEYQTITNAHFKSIETISHFFQYYLLLLSIPISVMAFVWKGADPSSIETLLASEGPMIGVVVAVFALVGLGMMCYAINLRLDAVLYARTINAIRRFFFEHSGLPLDMALRLRVLPQSSRLPPYHEKSFFWPVIAVFAAINSLYAGTGICLFFRGAPWLPPKLNQIFVFFTIGIAFHLLIYMLMARHREWRYLSAYAIGVDVDGVLNQHRSQFCRILKKHRENNRTGENPDYHDIEPSMITRIPVHKANLCVTREEERAVFNDPEYWTHMPPDEKSVAALNRIRNCLHLGVYIFTHRPWPDCEKKEMLRKLHIDFVSQCKGVSWRSLLSRLLIRMPVFASCRCFRFWPIEHITRQWLRKYGFKYRVLTIESGNDYCADPRGLAHNRFHLAGKNRLRFFVDDDLDKARKLSYFCDAVFLISQPYNSPSEGLPEEDAYARSHLPRNIIRVDDWEEIYNHLRILV